MKRKSPYPKCIGCGRKATRWDGGLCGYVSDSKTGKLSPGYIVWLCTRCDKYHKHFDLPDTLPGAIAEIVALREALQKMFVKNFEEVTDLHEKLSKKGVPRTDLELLREDIRRQARITLAKLRRLLGPIETSIKDYEGFPVYLAEFEENVRILSSQASKHVALQEAERKSRRRG